MKKSRERATAHHEAGHAVVAFYLFLPFKYVTVIPEKGSLGHVLHAPLGKSAFREYAAYSARDLKQQSLWERRVICGFAGRIAEEKYRGRRARCGYHSDYKNIANVVFRFGGEPEDVHVHWCRWLHARSSNLVSLRWPETQAVAKALIQHRRLTFDDVRRTINEWYRQKPVR